MTSSSRYTWEGNYVIGGREVLLEATVETGDTSVGMEGIQIVRAAAFDEEGKEILLTIEQFEAILNDGVLYERIDDQWRDESADAMERRRA